MHLTPTKGSSQITGHTKENSKAAHPKAGLPSPSLLLELSGDIKWQVPTLRLCKSILQLVFFSLCFIFSAQMEKRIGQRSSHLDRSAHFIHPQGQGVAGNILQEIRNYRTWVSTLEGIHYYRLRTHTSAHYEQRRGTPCVKRNNASSLAYHMGFHGVCGQVLREWAAHSVLQDGPDWCPQTLGTKTKCLQHSTHLALPNTHTQTNPTNIGAFLSLPQDVCLSFKNVLVGNSALALQPCK